MPDRLSHEIFNSGVIIALFVSLVLSTGCISSPPTIDQPPAASTAATPGLSVSQIVTPLQPPAKQAVTELVSVEVHNVTVYDIRQKSGNIYRMAVLDLSLKNNGLQEAFTLDNTTLVAVEQDPDMMTRVRPDSWLPAGILKNPLLPRNLSPGEETRGEVTFEMVKKPGSKTEFIGSIAVYLVYPNWTLAGQVAIPAVTNGTRNIIPGDYPKNLDLVVHSAILNSSGPPGITLSPGNWISVINVSITNNNPLDITIQREQLLVLTEQGITLEHGGTRTIQEVARNYLSFPLTIRTGETVTGPVFYIVRAGTRTNRIALLDSNQIINKMVDLDGILHF